MATYEYQCDLDGVFEVTRPLGTAPESVPCSVCGSEARRVLSIPMVRSGSRRALFAAIEHRGQEPLRTGRGYLAAFNRRSQANARGPADPHSPAPPQAMTIDTELAIAIAIPFARRGIGDRRRIVSDFHNGKQLTDERSRYAQESVSDG